MKNRLQGVLEAFDGNLQQVFGLAQFDHIVLDFAVQVLDGVQKHGHTANITNYLHTVDRGLQQLRSIRENDSLRPQYEHIFNQCVVLLVSHFSSAVHDLFSVAIAEGAKTRPTDDLLEEELKLTVKELLDIGEDRHGQLTHLLMRKGDINFQDMQSTARAFEKYCGHRPERDHDVNNIILGQACRHVIVHSGAIVDKRCFGQLKASEPRALKPVLTDGQRVQFTIDELKTLGASMTAYLRKLTAALCATP